MRESSEFLHSVKTKSRSQFQKTRQDKSSQDRLCSLGRLTLACEEKTVKRCKTNSRLHSFEGKVQREKCRGKSAKGKVQRGKTRIIIIHVQVMALHENKTCATRPNPPANRLTTACHAARQPACMHNERTRAGRVVRKGARTPACTTMDGRPDLVKRTRRELESRWRQHRAVLPALPCVLPGYARSPETYTPRTATARCGEFTHMTNGNASLFSVTATAGTS
eukprot:scpid56769/ scgid2749/ 